MRVTVGSEGLKKSRQGTFPLTVKCYNCGGVSLHAFTAHEGIDEEDAPDRNLDRILRVRDLAWTQEKKDGFWPHEFCAVAVYICPECREITSRMNQG